MSAEIRADRGDGQDPGPDDRAGHPQCTAVRRWVAPTPTIAPVMVWVVLTGMPPREAPIMAVAAAVSAQETPMVRSFVILVPMVLTIRQPPAMVPRAMTV